MFMQEVYEFLSPANKVWGKIMFLHVSVILSTVILSIGGLHLGPESLYPGAWDLYPGLEGLCMGGGGFHLGLEGSPSGSGGLHLGLGGSLSRFRGSLRVWRGICSGPPPPNQKSGRYASYWNAFLLWFFLSFVSSPLTTRLTL